MIRETQPDAYHGHWRAASAGFNVPKSKACARDVSAAL